VPRITRPAVKKSRLAALLISTRPKTARTRLPSSSR
jgi:hypothetical protein